MAETTVVLVDKKEVAKDTMSFHFEKPSGFTYKAGQFVEIELINPSETDEEGNKRAFSLASAPYESDIFIATRMRDTAFKRVLKQAPAGTKVKLFGPFGAFTLPSDPNIVSVYLTGGIGITPVRSIVLQATKDKASNQIFMFYSNRFEQDAAFLDDLQKASEENNNFKFFPTMTQDQNWTGEKGRIDKAMLKKYLGDKLLTAKFYISGPEAMVGAMREMLAEAKVPKENTRSEEFPGY